MSGTSRCFELEKHEGDVRAHTHLLLLRERGQVLGLVEDGLELASSLPVFVRQLRARVLDLAKLAHVRRERALHPHD